MEHFRQTGQRLVEQNGQYLWKLWLQFFAYGGDAGMFELEAFLYGMYELSALDRLILAVAVTETAT